MKKLILSFTREEADLLLNILQRPVLEPPSHRSVKFEFELEDILYDFLGYR